MASHPHSALQIYQFIAALHQACNDKDIFQSILLSLQTPRFTNVKTIFERWGSTFATHLPHLYNDFNQLISSADRSSNYDALLIRVSEHYYLIYRVSCFLENDLELELFVRCLCLDSSTPVSTQEVKQTLLQFLNQLSFDSREYVQEILIQDHHGYLTKEECIADDDKPACLDLDRVYKIINDPKVFDELMAIIQTNTATNVLWSQTIQEIHDLVFSKGVWSQLAPLLQTHIKRDYTDYDSYEDYVQKNFLDNGGQAYLDNEIERAQVEHMFGNLKM